LSKNPSEPAPIKQRFIACVQSTGHVGKSMVADGILSWLSFAGIPHAAIDTDVQHHTLSDRYKMHLLDATSSEDEFEQLLENLPESPTLIVDFPGNKTSKILEFAAHFQMLKSFRASGIRPTLLIFTADDSTAKDSALETLEFFGDAADYLLIENSARFKSDSFKATPLYDEFVARNSPTLVVPRISAGTLNAWEAAQHRLGEYLSLDKICKAEGLNVTSVLELAGVRDRFLVGCEDCASHIIPDLALIKNKVQRAGDASTKRPANRLGNPLLVRKN
jgi:hypothetical protein